MRTDRRARPGTKSESGGNRRSIEWLYGRNSVNEALLGRRSLELLYIQSTAKQHQRIEEIAKQASNRRVTIKSVDRQVLDQLLPGANHQGVALAVSPYPYVELEEISSPGAPILALDHLVDPQNVGTLLRTAEAFGISGVLMPRDRSAEITPAVVNASAGAVEHLNIAQVTNLAVELARLKERGWWLIGIENRPEAQVLGAVSIPTPAILLIGSEGQGIGPNLLRHCDLLMRIEMRGKVNSLNAATAGAIALFQIVSQSR